MNESLDVARRVVLDEAAALTKLAERIAPTLEPIVKLLLAPGMQVIVSGLGKSGNIAQKIAASLTSTGTPATFMHPVEALHGDLGIVTERHCLLALSRSGNTDEVVRFAVHFRRLGGPVVGMTQGGESKLVELSHRAIVLPDLPEAGPLSLAPTTSCVMMLAAGDALAMALLHARGFKPEQFARYHPEGPLGRRLLLRARDVMHDGDRLPIVRGDQTYDDLLGEGMRKSLGLVLIIDDAGKLIGTFTDGDFRRLDARVSNPHTLSALQAWQKSRRDSSAPRVPVSTVAADTLAVDCMTHMRDGQISSLVVSDDAGRPIGLIRLMDLVQHGIS